VGGARRRCGLGVPARSSLVLAASQRLCASSLLVALFPVVPQFAARTQDTGLAVVHAFLRERVLWNISIPLGRNTDDGCAWGSGSGLCWRATRRGIPRPTVIAAPRAPPYPRSFLLLPRDHPSSCLANAPASLAQASGHRRRTRCGGGPGLRGHRRVVRLPLEGTCLSRADVDSAC
jgi:hypothetical protein